MFMRNSIDDISIRDRSALKTQKEFYHTNGKIFRTLEFISYDRVLIKDADSYEEDGMLIYSYKSPSMYGKFDSRNIGNRLDFISDCKRNSLADNINTRF